MMNNENGRSRVEMLGVLAIIGVLSVAGNAGYSLAMRKYRVNEILNAASQCAVLALAQAETTATSATITASSLGYTTGDTSAVSATVDGTSKTIVVPAGYATDIGAATKCEIGDFTIPNNCTSS